MTRYNYNIWLGYRLPARQKSCYLLSRHDFKRKSYQW